MVRGVTPEGRLGLSEIGGVATLTHRELPPILTGRHPLPVDQDRPAQLTLRSRAEMLTHLGVTPPKTLFDTESHSCFAGTLSEFTESVESMRQAEAHITDAIWQNMSIRRSLIGLGSLNTRENPEQHRSMIILVGLFDGSNARVDAVRALLGAVMPRMTLAAINALGTEPMDGAQWLTAREQRVLEKLALGKSVREIAAEFDRSPHTVHDHVKSLHRKLGASSRGELIARLLGHIASADASGHTEADVNATESRRVVLRSIVAHNESVEQYAGTVPGIGTVGATGAIGGGRHMTVSPSDAEIEPHVSRLAAPGTGHGSGGEIARTPGHMSTHTTGHAAGHASGHGSTQGGASQSSARPQPVVPSPGASAQPAHTASGNKPVRRKATPLPTTQRFGEASPSSGNRGGLS